MIRFVNGTPIDVYQYLWLMKWAALAIHSIEKEPDTIVETNHFMMDVRGGQVIKY